MEPLYDSPPYGVYPPFRFRNPFYRNYNYTYNRPNSYNDRKNHNERTKNINKSGMASASYRENEARDMNSPPKPIFEIFGINLFFDDILLISLIFFLYNEGVQDQSLFIALILLLLS